jgi:hypothetical protein
MLHILFADHYTASNTGVLFFFFLMGFFVWLHERHYRR